MPAGVCTAMLKLPGVGIIEELMVTVSCELLFTAVARVARLRSTTEEETNWLPVTVSTKLGGNCDLADYCGHCALCLSEHYSNK